MQKLRKLNRVAENVKALDCFFFIFGLTVVIVSLDNAFRLLNRQQQQLHKK